MFWNCVAGVVVAGMLVLAWPQMVHQATSDDGDWHSGATPECPSWHDEVGNSLPPTCEYNYFYDYEQEEDE